ncbi:MAG: cytochrome o ubiquinol oxidase subunit III [Gammaproteobacteria bacterium]
MHNELAAAHDDHHDSDSTDVFGFWLYIMTDCILFGCLFATFIVLNFQGMQHGPALKGYLDLKDVLIETFVLLASNFTFCLAFLGLYKNKIRQVQAWLVITFLLGASFIFIEVSEFVHLAQEGFRWDISAQASSFFTLVGTHGLHVTFGLLWILMMIVQLPMLRKAPEVAMRRMTYLGLFWNFLDIVWIFVFTIVYLTGSM